MKERIKTLVLDANGVGWKAITLDTMLQGFLRIKDMSALPTSLHQNSHPLVRKIVGLFGQRYEALSYVIDWREAICDSPELDVEVCNINNFLLYRRCYRAISQYELIIILHSAAGDSMSLLLKTVDSFNRRRGKIVMFIGNEYSLMAEKMRFIRSVEPEYVCSQLPLETARWLYADATHSQILSVPHALNPKLYCPNPNTQRTVDIGFIGALYDRVIGDMERTNLIQYFQVHGTDLDFVCDIRTKNIPRSEWAKFLNKCKGTLGAESGTYYLDRTGHAIANAKAFLKAHPDATFEEIFECCFKNCSNVVSGKTISSRHFEPIGTKTCQILVEGHYNGILLADEHYISIKKDLSNINDAIHRFKDDEYRKTIAGRSYEYVMDEHTYRQRVETLLKEIVN